MVNYLYNSLTRLLPLLFIKDEVAQGFIVAYKIVIYSIRIDCVNKQASQSIASTVGFLLSPAAEMMTGNVVDLHPEYADGMLSLAPEDGIER